MLPQWLSHPFPLFLSYIQRVGVPTRQWVESSPDQAVPGNVRPDGDGKGITARLDHPLPDLRQVQSHALGLGDFSGSRRNLCTVGHPWAVNRA